MGKFIDLTGQVFGRLTVLKLDHKRPKKGGGNNYYWLCRCECGNLCVVSAGNLKSENTTSCGCYNIEKLIERSKTHGMEGTKIYRTWHYMKQRCENPNAPGFDRYGGRGIKVCERWHDFQNFYADVSILPHFGEKGYTLDRIDVNGDYCPENVRWATAKEQANNRRNNIKVEYNGEEMCLLDAAKLSSINYPTLHSRYHAGKRGDDLFASADIAKSHKNY